MEPLHGESFTLLQHMSYSSPTQSKVCTIDNKDNPDAPRLSSVNAF